MTRNWWFQKTCNWWFRNVLQRFYWRVAQFDRRVHGPDPLLVAMGDSLTDPESTLSSIIAMRT
jgi:hypothetical protein